MKISEIWANAWKALNNNNEGFSITKCIAALFAVFCVYAGIRYTTDSNVLAMIGLFFSAIFTLLIKKSVENTRRLRIEKGADGPKDETVSK